VITGQINRAMELEGKRLALDLIRREAIRTKAIADLIHYAQQQPHIAASGVKIVIDVLKGQQRHVAYGRTARSDRLAHKHQIPVIPSLFKISRYSGKDELAHGNDKIDSAGAGCAR
jgi:hypothetical protein